MNSLCQDLLGLSAVAFLVEGPECSGVCPAECTIGVVGSDQGFDLVRSVLATYGLLEQPVEQGVAVSLIVTWIELEQLAQMKDSIIFSA